MRRGAELGNRFRPSSFVARSPETRTMADRVLIYSRFPKTMMARLAARFELLDTGGKPAREVFSTDELGGIRALLTAGGTPLGAEAMDLFPKLGAIVCYGTGYDGGDLKAA